MTKSLGTDFDFKNAAGEIAGLRIFDEPAIEDRVPLPPLFGEGTLTTIASRPDIGIMIVRHRPSQESIIVDTRIPVPMIKMGYAMQARSCSAWLDGFSKPEPVSSGSLCVSSPTSVIRFKDADSADFDFLTLTMGCDFILGLVEEYGERLSPDFERLLREPGGEPSLIVSTFGWEARGAVEKIRNRGYVGAPGRLYAESATLELAAISLRGLIGSEDGGARNKAFSARDAKRMREAGELLDGRFIHPPSIAQLARELGESEAKLKRDFKRAHGMGVHEYIVARRMDYAKQRILEGELSVKEAAFIVGYKSPSHFSEAFARRFGFSPGSRSRR
jgi:AraC-like DNA-binding protein